MTPTVLRFALALVVAGIALQLGYVGVVVAQPTSQPFTFSSLPHSLPNLRHGTAVWGDYDGDGDLDALLSGIAEVGEQLTLRTVLYRHEGRMKGDSVVFTPVQTLHPLAYSAAAWGDYDGDGDLDLAILGSTTRQSPYNGTALLYRNDAGTLVEVPGNFVGLHSGTVNWGDYDGDGDLDLLMTGEEAPDRYRTVLYRNDPGASGRQFTSVAIDVVGIGYGKADWGDYDRDGDLDLALTGVSGQGLVTLAYRNDPSGSGRRFTPLATSFEGVAFGSVDWGDYDGDGDLDLLASGGQFSFFIMSGLTRLYRNDGGDRFTSVDAGFTGALSGGATWGDYDDDGDLDVFILGAEDVIGRRVARLYRNDGPQGFFPLTHLVGTLFASADWGDFDGDGDLDLLTSGFRPTVPALTLLYENRRLPVRVPPSAPVAKRADVSGRAVTFAWDVPTLAPDATFNLRVGTTPGAADVMAAMADLQTGRRLLSAPGNTGRRTGWSLDNLPNGTYYWSVQALNGSFTASPFSEEGQFTVAGGVGVGHEGGADLPQRFRVYPAYPNPFDRQMTLRYDLPEAAPVMLKVYTLLGEVVWQERLDRQPAGTHAFVWDGRTADGRVASAGVYVYDLQAGTARSSGKLIRVK